MQTIPLQLNDVIYNAANQSFEALVSVHDANGTKRYACAIDAPIDMEFEAAASGLTTQALRRHGRGQVSSVQSATPAPQRAGRPTPLREVAHTDAQRDLSQAA